MAELNLGSLLLELGIDQASIQKTIEQGRSIGLGIAKGIEKEVAGVKLGTIDTRAMDNVVQKAQQVNRGLHLTPTVDSKQVHDLNKLFDLKASHAQSTNEKLKLRPAVDVTQLETLTNHLKVMESSSGKPIIVKVAAQDPSALNSIGGRMANAVGKGFDSTIGSIFRGAFEGIGRELSNGVATGLTGAIESALGQKIGSTELFTRRLTEAIGSDVKAGLAKSFDALPKTVQERLKATAQELGGISAEIVTPEEALIESKAKLAKKRQRITRNRELARDELTIERREDLRNYRGINDRRVVIANEQRGIVAATEKGEDLRDRLTAELKVAEFDKNTVRVKELQNAILDVSESLAFLSQSEAALAKEYGELEKDLETAKKRIEASRSGAEMLRPNEQPKAYKDVLQAVTGGKIPKAGNIPALVVDDARLDRENAQAMYTVESNVIYVRKALKQAIDSGILSIEQYMTLLEEVGHAFDFDFGSTKGVDARRNNSVLTASVNPTTEEVKAVSRDLQGYAPEERAVELQAKVRARRLAPKLYQQQESERERARVEKVLGFNGGDFTVNLKRQLAEMQSVTGQIQELSLKSNVAIGVGLGEFITQLELFEKKLAGVNARIESMNTDGNSIGLMREIGGINDESEALQGALPELKDEFVGRLKKDIAHKERLKTVEAVGRNARAVVDGAIGVAQSKPVQMAAGLIGGGVKLGYKGLQAAESLALDALPFGRTAKAIGQHVVLPAVGMTAAAHAIPGVGAAMGAAGDLAAMAMGPIAHNLAGTAGANLAQNLPNLMGIQTVVAEAITGNVEKGLLLGAAMGGKAAAVGGGGVAIKQALALPFKVAQTALQPLGLRSAEPPKQLELHTKPSMSIGESQLSTLKAAGEASRSAAQEAIDRSKAISAFFVKQKNVVKAAILAGDMDLAAQKMPTLRAAATAAQSELDEQKGFGVDAKVRAAKTQVTKSIKAVEKLFESMTRIGGSIDDEMKNHQKILEVSSFPAKLKRPATKASTPQIDAPDEELGALKQRLNLGRVKVAGAQSSNKIAADAEVASDRFDKASERFSKSLDDRFQRSTNGILAAAEAIANLGSATSQSDQKFNRAVGTLDTLLGGFLAFQAISFVAPMFMGIAKASTTAALEMQKFQRILDATAKGGSQQALPFLSGLSDKLGVNFRESIGSYAQLASSTRETSLEGASTEQINRGLATASAAFNLDAEQQKGASLAMSQMASKGVVSMEELRQQLGERIPGAMQIASRSMGVTTAELNAMVSSGQVMAEDFLPKFAQQMETELAGAADRGSQSAQASFARLDNAIFKTQAAIGEGVLPVQKMGADAAVGALNLIAGNAQLLTTILQSLSVLAAVNVGNGLRIMAIGAFNAAGGMSALGTMAAFTGKQLLALNTNAGLIKFVGIFAAIQGFQRLGEMAKDSAGKIREIADSSKKANEELSALLDKSNKGNTSKTPGTFIERASAQESLLEGMPGFSFLPKEVGRVVEKFGQENEFGKMQTAPVRAVSSFLGGLARGEGFGAFGTGFNEIFNPRTLQDKQREDRQIAINDVLESANSTTMTVNSNLGISRQGVGDITKLKGIDKQLADVQQQRRALDITGNSSDPKVVAEKKALMKAEQDLIRQREESAKSVGKLSQTTDIQVKNLRDLLGTLDPLSDEYKKVEEALQSMEKTQADLNAATKGSILNLENYARSWDKIMASLQDAKTAIDVFSSQQSSAIGKAELSGNINQAGSEYLDNLRQQNTELAKQQQNLAKIAELQALQNNPQVQQKLQSYGINENTGAAEITRIANDKKLGEADKTIVERAAQLRSLQDETAQMNASIVQAQVAAKRKLDDSTRAINDFFRGVQQTADTMALDAKAVRAETAAMANSNKLKGALSKSMGDFANSLGDTFISIIQAYANITKNTLDLEKLKLSQSQGFQNLQTQAGELMRNSLPMTGGGIPGMGGGGSIGGGVNATPKYNVFSVTDGGQSKVINDYDQSMSHHTYQQGHNGEVRDYVLVEAQGDPWSASDRVPVPSPLSGKVITAGDGGAAGNHVVIEDGNGQRAMIGHLSSIAVQMGQFVKFGESIGIQGSTGRSQAPHVHIDAPSKVIENWLDNAVLKQNPAVFQPQQIAQPQGTHTSGLSPIAGLSGPQPQGTSAKYAQPQMMQGGGSNRDMYLHRLAQLESDFNPRQGYTTVEGGGYADGYFQFTPITVQDAQNAGIGDPRVGNIGEQASKTWKFIQTFHPEAAKAIDAGNFSQADSMLRGRWTSLPGGGEQGGSERLALANTWLQPGKAMKFSVGGPGGGGVGGGMSGVSMPSIGPSVADMEQFNANSQKIGATLAVQQAANADFLKAQEERTRQANAAELFEAQKQFTNAQKMARDNKYAQERTRNTQADATQDEELALLPDDPQSKFKRDSIAQSRKTRDRKIELRQSIEQSQDELTALKKLRDEMAKVTGIPEDVKTQSLGLIDGRIKDYDKSIKTAQTAYSKVDELDKKMNAKLVEQLAADKKRQDLAKRRTDIDAEAQEIQPKISQLQRSGDPEAATNIQRLHNLKKNTLEIDEKIFEVEERQRLNGLDKTVAEAEIARLKAIQVAQAAEINREADRQTTQRRIEENVQIVTGRKEFTDTRIQQLRYQNQPQMINELQAEMQFLDQRASFEGRKNELKEMLDSGKLSKVAFDELNRTLERTNEIKLDNITREAKKLREATAFGALQSKYGMADKLLGAQIENTRLRGGRTDEMEKEQAVYAANMEYISTVRQIREDANLTADDIDKLTEKAGALNEIKLDSINRQFSELNQISNQSQQIFADNFAGLLDGTKTFSDFLRDSLKSLGSFIAKMASDRLFKEIWQIFKSPAEKKREAEAAKARSENMADLGLSGTASKPTEAIIQSAGEFKNVVLATAAEFRDTVLSGLNRLGADGTAQFGSVASIARYLTPDSFAPIDLARTVEADSDLGANFGAMANLTRSNALSGIIPSVFTDQSIAKTPLSLGGWEMPEFSIGEFSSAPSLSNLGTGSFDIQQPIIAPIEQLSTASTQAAAPIEQLSTTASSASEGLKSLSAAASQVPSTLSQAQNSWVPIPTRPGSTPFPPFTEPDFGGGGISWGGLSSVRSEDLGLGGGSLLSEFGGADLGESLVSGANQAVSALQDGTSQAASVFAQSGQGAAKGLGQGIQGLLGTVDAFSSGNILGGISGILGMFMPGSGLFGGLLGGLFGGGKADGGPIADDLTYIPNLASGGLLSSISDAMARENAASAGRPVLLVANDRERVLSESQNRRFEALGLESIVNGKVPNYANGGYLGKVANYAEGGTVDYSTSPSVDTSGANTNTSNQFNISVSGGGEYDTDALQQVIQSEIARQDASRIQTMRAIATDVIVQNRRPGGLL